MIKPKTPFNLGGSSAIWSHARHDRMTTPLEKYLVGISFVDCFFIFLLCITLFVLYFILFSSFLYIGDLILARTFHIMSMHKYIKYGFMPSCILNFESINLILS
jgi:hypothetical protein